MYEKYLKLGFKRTETFDNVEFKNTGYSGFILSKQINKKMSIEVCSGELGLPKLYIKKSNSESYHVIIEIDFEVVEDLLK